MAKSAIFSMVIAIILLSNAAFAIPGIPNRFYGTVNFIDGPAPDGSIVEAKIGSTIVASTTTFGGTYGYAPNIFDINDPNNNRNGNTVQFFINGADTGKTAIFTNGDASEVNLNINEYINKNSKTNQQTSDSSSGTAGGSILKPSVSKESCNSNWYCTDWSSCSNNVQTRNCVDINYCTTPTSKPVLNQECGKPETSDEKNDLNPLETTNNDSEPINMPTGRFSSVTLNNVRIVAVILILVAIIWQVRKK